MKSLIGSIQFFVIFVFLCSGCDEVSMPLGEVVLPTSNRVVLIEKLTGAKCPNCPRGSTTIDNIIQKYEGRVAAVSVHGAFLAEPTSISKYDFRNPKARALEKSFTGWLGKPTASINRTPDEDGDIMIDNPDLWQVAVERELIKPELMTITIDTKYEEASRRLEVDIKGKALFELEDNYSISVYLTESKIVDAQSSGPLIIEDYVHKHVLRDMLTTATGDSFGSKIKKDAVVQKSYAYTLPSLPEGLWKVENMEVVVMVNNNKPKDVSVIQAAVKRIKS
jgi:Outer membrane protein Omp28